MIRGLRAALVAVVIAAAASAAEPPRSGHPVFDRAVGLVFTEYYDVSALDRFADAAQSQIKHPRSPLDANSTQSRVDAAIDAVLASLGASHTGRFRPEHDRLFRTGRHIPLWNPQRQAPAFPAGRQRHLSGHRHGRHARRRAAGSSATSMTAFQPMAPEFWSATRSPRSTANPTRR